MMKAKELAYDGVARLAGFKNGNAVKRLSKILRTDF
jgi:hypothetical protein